MTNHFEKSLEMHKRYQGKLETVSKVKLTDRDALSQAYSPGVAQPCIEIASDPQKAYEYTLKGRTVAVVSDGSAVLGLGNIGALGALPVMEGKCVLFKEFAGVDAFPIVLDTQDPDEIVRIVKAIAPTFGGINLEDISAPRCFEIEARLKAELDIPVMHDDQHGTAMVTLAGLINALKLTHKTKETIKVVINGAGAAGVAIARLMHLYGVANIVMCDSKGIISSARDNLDASKQALLAFNAHDESGTLLDALKGADVFVGVSKGGLLHKEDIAQMNADPVIFALANPTPEIMPEEAKEAGARIIGTGRSDYPNQINNVLVFPGIFKGALAYKIQDITDEHKLKASQALADYVTDLDVDHILPDTLDKGVADAIAKSMQS